MFDPQIHLESINGDDVGAGDGCVVVIPALVKDRVKSERDSSRRTRSTSFRLSLLEV